MFYKKFNFSKINIMPIFPESQEVALTHKLF